MKSLKLHAIRINLFAFGVGKKNDLSKCKFLEDITQDTRASFVTTRRVLKRDCKNMKTALLTLRDRPDEDIMIILFEIL